MDVSRSALKLMLSKSLKAVVFFLGVTFFARELGAGPMGVFFLFRTVIGLSSLAADLGIRGALEKRLSEGQNPSSPRSRARAPGAMLGTALVCKLALLSVTVAGILLFRGSVEGYLGGAYVPHLVVALVCWVLTDLYISALRGELRVGETALVHFVRESAWVLVGFVFFLAGFGVLGLIYGLIIGTLLALVIAFVRCETSIGRPTRASIRSVVDYAKYYSISSVGGRVYQWMDIAIIGLFLTYTEVGAYEVAWEITLLVLIASDSIATTLFPQMSNWNADAETDRIATAVSNAVGITLFISLPALLGTVVIGENILRVVFGPEFVIAFGALVVLMGEKVVQAANGVLDRTIQALNRPDLTARAMVVTIVLNLVLNFALIPRFGILGAALATTFSVVADAILHAFYLSRLIDLDIQYSLIGWCVVLSVAMGAILIGLQSVVPVGGVVSVLAYVLAGIVVYFSLSTLVPSVRRTVIVPGVRFVGSLVT